MIVMLAPLDGDVAEYVTVMVRFIIGVLMWLYSFAAVAASQLRAMARRSRNVA